MHPIQQISLRTSEGRKEVQSKLGLSLACIYKQRHATSNECRSKQHNASSEWQRDQLQLPNVQPSCSNSAEWSNSKRARYGECFSNIFSNAKARGKDEEIRYRIQSQDATGTGTVRTEEISDVNANEGTGNQASSTGGRAWARALIEENSIREWWCLLPALETNHPSTGPQRRKMSQTGPVGSTSF